MLNFTINSLEDAASGTEGFYKEGDDGRFHLQVTGGPKDQSEDVVKLKRSLDAAREDVKAAKNKFAWAGDLTPEEVQELRDAKEDLETQLGDKKGASQEEIEERAERLAARKTRKLEQDLANARNAIANHENAIGLHEAAGNQRRIRDAVDSALTGKDAVQVYDSAREDIYPYAERIMTVLEDGSVVSRDGVGVDPEVSIKEILTDLQTAGKKDHWFKRNESGDLNGNRNPNTVTGDNPFKDGPTFSVTKIGQLKKADPKRATALCKAAGKDPKKFGLEAA